jgi:aryl-alcohol dehydrogenase-like predicted oxidoreductase
MEKRAFGKLGEISCLTLGGGGIGQVWGSTSRDEAIATVIEAVEAGITFLDLAPAYGKGEAELVVARPSMAAYLTASGYRPSACSATLLARRSCHA